jgi:S-adenosylmethionine:tRNA-ribosyltransferase-isomerase (queuine synthetase)
MMNGLKSKVLKDLIDVLEQEDGKMLMKHPKVMAAKLTVAKPLDKKEVEPEIEEEEMDDEGALDQIEDLSELESMPDDLKEKLMKLLSK